MNRFRALLGIGITSVFGLCLWHNKKAYADKSWKWNGLKSLVETIIICLSAWKCPAVLVGWCTVWFTRPVKKPTNRVILGAIAGAVFGFLEIYFFEGIVVISVFAIDLVTGANGFLKRYKEVEEIHGPDTTEERSLV